MREPEGTAAEVSFAGALALIEQAARVVESAQAQERNGGRWYDLEEARRALHGAAISLSACSLDGRQLSRSGG